MSYCDRCGSPHWPEDLTKIAGLDVCDDCNEDER